MGQYSVLRREHSIPGWVQETRQRRGSLLSRSSSTLAIGIQGVISFSLLLQCAQSNFLRVVFATILVCQTLEKFAGSNAKNKVSQALMTLGSVLREEEFPQKVVHASLWSRGLSVGTRRRLGRCEVTISRVRGGDSHRRRES